ncbi:MAG TPA: hypothetical protein VFW60_02700 [Rhodanobacteraceae bacterium]|nr:hypothetical protein [Rhodanobacteraceae bacterium]
MRILAVNTMSRSIALAALATGILLLVPLAAMQFTDEVVWTALDFSVAGALLFGAGLAFALLTRTAGTFVYRAAAGIAVAAALMLVWVNLAVGIIGSEDNPANLMYAGVIAIEITGVLLARLRPAGMSRAMFAAAIVQMAVAVIALAGGLGATEPPGRLGILVLNGFFVALFAGSALLFRHAARSRGARKPA